MCFWFWFWWESGAAASGCVVHSPSLLITTLSSSSPLYLPSHSLLLFLIAPSSFSQAPPPSSRSIAFGIVNVTFQPLDDNKGSNYVFSPYILNSVLFLDWSGPSSFFRRSPLPGGPSPFSLALHVCVFSWSRVYLHGGAALFPSMLQHVKFLKPWCTVAGLFGARSVAYI